MVQERGTIRLRGLATLLLGAPAILGLAAAPAAAVPRLHLIELCIGGRAGTALLPGPEPSTPSDRRHEQGGTGCAHMLCPRGALAGRKARLPG